MQRLRAQCDASRDNSTEQLQKEKPDVPEEHLAVPADLAAETTTSSNATAPVVLQAASPPLSSATTRDTL